MSPNRYLIKEGPLSMIKKKKVSNGYFYLFNDMVIYAAESKKGNKKIKDVYHQISWVEDFASSLNPHSFKVIFDLKDGKGALVSHLAACSDNGLLQKMIHFNVLI